MWGRDRPRRLPPIFRFSRPRGYILAGWPRREAGNLHPRQLAGLSHCERSEAIPRLNRDCFGLRPRNDDGPSGPGAVLPEIRFVFFRRSPPVAGYTGIIAAPAPRVKASHT